MRTRTTQPPTGGCMSRLRDPGRHPLDEPPINTVDGGVNAELPRRTAVSSFAPADLASSGVPQTLAEREGDCDQSY